MNTKKLVLLLLVVFLGFWMFTDPSGLAENAKAAGGWAWDLVTDLFGAVIRFIKQL